MLNSAREKEKNFMKNSTSIDNDLKKILVGTWVNQSIRGEPITDMDMFENYHLGEYAPIISALRKGESDPLEICRKSGFMPSEVSNLMGYEQYTQMYGVGILNLQKKLADEWIGFHEDASPEEIAENMQRFTKKTGKLPTVTEDPFSEMLDELDRIKNEKHITTGLAELDKMMCGVRRKELTAVGARPSVGKSAFLQQVAMRVAKQDEKVLFFPLEMSQNAIMQRMLMRYTDIPQKELRFGITRETMDREASGYAEVSDFMAKGNFMIFERVNDIEVIKELIELHKPYMVAIDQLEQLKSGNQRWEDKRQRFSYMTHEMQAISLDMNVAVWFACQVNRGADNTPPTMANLKESGTIEEDSTNVILLHREGDKTAMQDITLDLAKQKDGECGTVNLKFDAPHYTFRGVDWRY